MIYIILILLNLMNFAFTHVQETHSPDKTVLVAILARNKAHVLPRFLRCIENQDYPKNLMTLYINTNNNIDQTVEILDEWISKNEGKYKKIIFDKHEISDLPEMKDTPPHAWNVTRFNKLAEIRNKSLRQANEYKCDYYFVADCDNFIAPFTLTDLVNANKPIIAPLLRSIPEPNDPYANFFYDVDSQGYYKDHPNFHSILTRKLVGTFKVPVVHCTYLINSNYIDKLNYIDNTEDYEFIVFSRSARLNNIVQYITNEKEYGVQIHFHQNMTLDEEKNRLEAILTLT